MAWLDASVGRLSIHVFSVFENTKYLYFYNAYVLNLSLVWVWTEMWNTPHFQRAQWPLEYIWRQIRNTKIHYRCKTPLPPPVQWEPPWIAVLLWGLPSKENWWSSFPSWFPFWSENAFLVTLPELFQAPLSCWHGRWEWSFPSQYFLLPIFSSRSHLPKEGLSNQPFIQIANSKTKIIATHPKIHQTTTTHPGRPCQDLFSTVSNSPHCRYLPPPPLFSSFFLRRFSFHLPLFSSLDF